jgi:hypothetical protein
MILAQTEGSQQEQIRVIIILMVLGLSLIGISIPLLYGKIGPNWFYGFKTRKTLSDREIWYKANKYMAKDFIKLGSMIALYNLVFLILFILQIDIVFVISAGSIVVLVGGAVVVAVRGLLYLRKL